LLGLTNLSKLEGSEGAQSEDTKVLHAVSKYIKEHPIQFALQTGGAVALTASVALLPILGAVGFTAVGPAAGSAAAAWQASIGAVEAGSLFAWCQVSRPEIREQ
jgi:hypothetical protein